MSIKITEVEVGLYNSADHLIYFNLRRVFFHYPTTYLSKVLSEVTPIYIKGSPIDKLRLIFALSITEKIGKDTRCLLFIVPFSD